MSSGALASTPWGSGRLPHGVARRPLAAHGDHRGGFTEVHRDEWWGVPSPVQWNVVRSHAHVLRGVHVHTRHADLLHLIEGRATIGLRDLRPGSPTEHAVALVELHAGEPAVLSIPPGVAHGFLFHAPSIHVYGVTRYWDPADELGCHWADLELGIPWPLPPGGAAALEISARDQALPPLSQLVGRIPAWSADAPADGLPAGV